MLKMGQMPKNKLDALAHGFMYSPQFKIMEEMLMIKTMILLMAVSGILWVSTASAEKKYYWAYVQGGDTVVGLMSAYGVAWNFPTQEEAINRATAECQNRIKGTKLSCGWIHTGHNSCFAIYKTKVLRGYMSNEWKYVDERWRDHFFIVRFERGLTKQEAKARANIDISKYRSDARSDVSLEMVKCAGYN